MKNHKPVVSIPWMWFWAGVAVTLLVTSVLLLNMVDQLLVEKTPKPLWCEEVRLQPVPTSL